MARDNEILAARRMSDEERPTGSRTSADRNGQKGQRARACPILGLYKRGRLTGTHAHAGIELQAILQAREPGPHTANMSISPMRPGTIRGEVDAPLVARLDRQKVFEDWKQSLQRHAIPDAPLMDILKDGASLSSTDRKYKLRNGRSRDYLLRGLDLFAQQTQGRARHSKK